MEELIKKVSFALVDINKNDMTKAELTIANLLIKSGFAKWEKIEDCEIFKIITFCTHCGIEVDAKSTSYKSFSLCNYCSRKKQCYVDPLHNRCDQCRKDIEACGHQLDHIRTKDGVETLLCMSCLNKTTEEFEVIGGFVY